MNLPSLAQCQRLYEEAIYELSLDKFSSSKTIVLQLIKQLNLLLKQQNSDEITDVKNLSSNSIELFQKIKTSSKIDMSSKLKWIGSNLRGEFYPPVLYDKIYIDDEPLTDLLHLSQSQTDQLVEWKQVTTQSWSTDGVNHLYQDLLQDCSFVASLITLARNNSIMLIDRIVPRKDQQRFGVVLNFNGCERLVVIGSQLPDLREKSLYVKSKTNKDLYWPAFIEKAYLKILGNGYEPKGSNSSIDTYFISGWIPEFISSIERPDMSSLWNELFDDFKSNKVVLNLGTDKFSTVYQPNHDYSIIDIVENNKTIILKNPWKENIKMIKFNEIFDHFETLYINWNPIRFQYHSSLNFLWNKDTILKNSLFNHPQFSIANNNLNKADIWVLVEKHIGFKSSSISATVYKSKGERLLNKREALFKSVSNNTGFHLSKFQLLPGEACTIIIFNDCIDQTTQNFTIHSYSNNSIEITRSPPIYPTVKWINGDWTVDSCGGNWSNQSFLKNPSYKLSIPKYHQDVKVKIGLFTDDEQLINVSLYWADASKPFSNKPIISDQQTLYHPSSMFQDFILKPDHDYTLIASTYDTDIISKFKLLINSEIPVQIEKISNRLGLFLKPFKFRWQNKNRFKLKMKVDRETEISIHLWSNVETLSKYRPKLRASLFYSNGQPIQINDEFDDNFYGIWLKKVSVTEIDDIVLLVERFEAGNDEVYGELGSNYKIEWGG